MRQEPNSTRGDGRRSRTWHDFVAAPAKTRAKPLADTAGKLLGDIFAKQGFGSGALVTHWDEIVGAEIAANTEPLKLQWPRVPAGEDEPGCATLVLRVEGPAAIEIQHLSGVILERVNRFLGWRAVGRVALRQAPLARRRKLNASNEPDALAVARVAKGLTGIDDEGLRNALARLGAAVERP
jgi:hypothetical protein